MTSVGPLLYRNTVFAIFTESWVPPTQKFDIYLENNYNECQTVRVTPCAPPATLATAVVVLRDCATLSLLIKL